MKKQTYGTLFLISTPIGNLEDLSPRGKTAIEEADLVYCEDTRRFSNLVSGLDLKLKNSPRSFFKDKEAASTLQVINDLKTGKKVALVSDAGTPLIADPGYLLVKSCRQENFKIIHIPGPSAFVSALVISGFPVSPFLFLGYLPKNTGNIKKVLRSCRDIAENTSTKTFVFYESPFRLLKTLRVLNEILGNTNIFIAEELTKLFEKTTLSDLLSLIEFYKGNKPRGEITGVFYLREK